jgi:hypothetical protein
MQKAGKNDSNARFERLSARLSGNIAKRKAFLRDRNSRPETGPTTPVTESGHGDGKTGT